MFKQRNFIKIAKRENNKKRNYLVVNSLQGKHIPVKPSEALSMFEELAIKIKEKYQKEKLLLIGFAETATAIGAAVANTCNTLYMHTTRETLKDVQYIYFSEQHSHATEQKLVRDDIDKIKNMIDRIVFVEDEVTTGNTILNIIDVLNQLYPHIKKYAVASLLNGMNDNAISTYKQRGIDLNYIVKTNHENYSRIAEQYAGDGEYFILEKLKSYNNIKYKMFHMSGYMDARRMLEIKKYSENIEKLFVQVNESFNFTKYKSVLVLGTEEFMYPALVIAAKIEKIVPIVYFHATTRSPIIVSSEIEYPLHKRYELESLYDKKRKTFLYDLCRYDCVIIITDASNAKAEGLASLAAALYDNGNEEINVIQWS